MTLTRATVAACGSSSSTTSGRRSTSWPSCSSATRACTACSPADSATEALRVLQDLDGRRGLPRHPDARPRPASSWPRCWPGSRPPPPVVFVTAHDEHAVDAFELDAVDYVLKPVRDGAARRGGPPRASQPAAGTAEPVRADATRTRSIPVELAGVTRFVPRSTSATSRPRATTPACTPPRAATCVRIPLSRAGGGVARGRLRAHPPLAAGLAAARRRGAHRGRPLHASWSAAPSCRSAAGTPASCATCWSARNRPDAVAVTPRMTEPAPAAGPGHQPRGPTSGRAHRGRRRRPRSTPRRELGEVYLRSLLRAQLRLALRGPARCSAVIARRRCRCCSRLAPGPGRRTTCSGMPLPWLLLGVRRSTRSWSPLGWCYVRRAERNERDFADVVERERLTRP